MGRLCLTPAAAVLVLEWLCPLFGILGVAGLTSSPIVPCSSLTVTLLFEDLDVHLRKSAMHPPAMFAKACLANLKTKLTATSQRYWIGIGVHAIHVIAKRFPANRARSRARSLGVRDCGLAGLLLAWGPWLCHPNSIFDGLSRAPHPWKDCTGSWPSLWQTGQDPV